MITRDLAGAFYVTGFDARTFHSSAKEIGAGGIATGNANSTFLGYNPTSCGFNGRIIDRYGLPEFYQSVLVMAAGQALGFDMSSTGVLAAQGLHVNYIGLSVGLDHNCSTGSGWEAFSTGQWSGEKAAYAYNACSTHIGLLTTATSTSDGLQNSTSTGPALASVAHAFDLTGAKRYIRMVVTPRLLASDCGVHNGVDVHGGLLFGHPQHAPTNYTKVGRISVTSACSTST